MAPELVALRNDTAHTSKRSRARRSPSEFARADSTCGFDRAVKRVTRSASPRRVAHLRRRAVSFLRHRRTGGGRAHHCPRDGHQSRAARTARRRLTQSDDEVLPLLEQIWDSPARRAIMVAAGKVPSAGLRAGDRGARLRRPLSRSRARLTYVARVVSITLDQFYRPQPGGIATYVRGLVSGLASLDDESLRVLGIAPDGHARPDDIGPCARPVGARRRCRCSRECGRTGHSACPRASDVVHATSVAGPYRRRRARRRALGRGARSALARRAEREHAARHSLSRAPTADVKAPKRRARHLDRTRAS